MINKSFKFDLTNYDFILENSTLFTFSGSKTPFPQKQLPSKTFFFFDSECVGGGGVFFSASHIENGKIRAPRQPKFSILHAIFLLKKKQKKIIKNDTIKTKLLHLLPLPFFVLYQFAQRKKRKKNSNNECRFFIEKNCKSLKESVRV